MINPPILAERRWWRLAVLCGLYVAQGVPFGFVTVTLAAAITKSMKDSGATNVQITEAISGIILFATLPWAFKWIAGPFVDRFGIRNLGRRRPWILLAQLGMVLTLVQMALLPDPAGQLKALAWLAFAHSVFNALQDVSVDALAVDLLPPEERGRVSGLMYGAKYFGTAIGGAGLSMVSSRAGLNNAFLAMIIVIMVISLLPLLTIERRGEHLFIPNERGKGDSNAGGPSFKMIFIRLFVAFRSVPALSTAVIALCGTAAAGILSPIGTQLFVGDLEWSEEKYGNITGGVAVFAGLGGAVLGGFLADKFGPRKIAAISTVAYGMLLTGFGVAETIWAQDFITVPYLVTESLLQGCFATSVIAICLGVSHPAIAATQFTAYMAMSNLATSWGTGISPWVQNTFGTSGAFVAAGVLQASLVVVLPFTLNRRSPEPE